MSYKGVVYKQGRKVLWVVYPSVKVISRSRHKEHDGIMIHEGVVDDQVKPVKVEYDAREFSVAEVREKAEAWSSKIELGACPRCRGVDEAQPQDQESYVFPLLPRPSAVGAVRPMLEGIGEGMGDEIGRGGQLRGTVRRRVASRLRQFF